jgi:hypothetical protein
MFGRKSRKRLLCENAAMREALSWYAAQETWRRKGIHQKGAPRKKWRKSPAAFDRGHLAIRVLTKLDEPNGAMFTVELPMHMTPAGISSDKSE